MLGRMLAGPEPGGRGGGVSEQRRQRDAAFDFFGGGRHTHTGTAAVPSSPMALVPPTKLFLAADGEEAALLSFSPTPPELESEAAVVMVSLSPTSTLEAPAASPTTTVTTSPATSTAVPPFSRRGAGATTTTSSSSSGMDDSDRRRSCKSRSQRRPWEARPVGVGLAGALNVGDGDAVPPAAATVLTVTTGQRIRPCQSGSAPSSALQGSQESRSRCRRCVLSPREMMMESASSEDYTRVIARGANPRTTHIFDGRVVVVVEGDEFLRWCHGCSKGLGQGNDIFMYRGEMAFCSHECRYREMLVFDEEEFNHPAE